METHVLNTISNRQSQRPQYTGFHHDDGNGNTIPRKTSAVVLPMPIQSEHKTPQKENEPRKPISVTPVLPGTGSVTHNITRMLSDAQYKRVSSTPEARVISNGNDVNSLFRTPDQGPFTPYYNYIRPTYRQPLLSQSVVKSPPENKSTTSEDDSVIDVVNDSQEHLRTGDVTNMTDSSVSTRSSTSPQSTGSSTSPQSTGSSTSPQSTGSSPGSGCGSATSPDVHDVPAPRKKARTNYSPDQVQTLEKMFHENPYPDSDMMETLGKDLGVPENKIKVWFQNKRARWRRRMNDNVNHYQHPFMPMSPVMSPVGPYGFMPPSPFMTSSPPQVMPGYLNYPSLSPNNNQSTPGNISPSRLHAASQQNMNQSSSTIVTQPTISPVTSSHSLMSSPHLRHLQYPGLLYPQSYGSYQQNFQ